MPNKQAWKEMVRELYGERSDVEVADITGVSQPWINQIKNGRMPSRETLALLADRLHAPTSLRGRLFRFLGYADPEGADTWDPDAAFTQGIRALQEEFGPFQWSSEVIPLARATPEEIDALLATMRRDMEKRRK